MLDKSLEGNLLDMHMHMDDRLKKVKGVVMMCNISNRDEYNQFKLWKIERSTDIFSVGVHPWNADTQCVENLIPYMNKANCIGEIGMDNVWCDISLIKQEEIFRKQLSYAYIYKKTVILHTKGMEETVANIIQDYPNTYIVHWFDAPKLVNLYLDSNCYFTIGPAVLLKAEIQDIASKVPIDRLLIETDGIAAMEWLYQTTMTANDYFNLLKDTYAYLANLHNLSIDQLKKQIIINAKRALKQE